MGGGGWIPLRIVRAGYGLALTKATMASTREWLRDRSKYGIALVAVGWSLGFVERRALGFFYAFSFLLRSSARLFIRRLDG